MSSPESEVPYTGPSLSESASELDEMARHQMAEIRAAQEQDISPEVIGDPLEVAAMQVVDESEAALEDASRGIPKGVKTAAKYAATSFVGGFAIVVIEALATSRGVHVPRELDATHLNELFSAALGAHYTRNKLKRSAINDQQSDAPSVETTNE
jgi:hypothetical protein